jgi:hypothetical protein
VDEREFDVVVCGGWLEDVVGLVGPLVVEVMVGLADVLEVVAVVVIRVEVVDDEATDDED